jgi:hypothetical protein
MLRKYCYINYTCRPSTLEIYNRRLPLNKKKIIFGVLLTYKNVSIHLQSDNINTDDNRVSILPANLKDYFKIYWYVIT